MNMHNFTAGTRRNRPEQIRILSDDDIRRTAPSVFATQAHHSRSDRYSYIPTSAVLEGMRKQGFLPVLASQSRCRTDDKIDFTKHMLRFRLSNRQFTHVGDIIPEIVLVNSHDGTSAYQLYAALFRLACSNGLVTCAGHLGERISVPHKGDITGRVIEGSFTVIDHAHENGQRALEWQNVALAHQEQEVLANAALSLRFDTDEKPAPITTQQILTPKRSEDVPNNLWTTFNRIQEHLINGGHRYRAENGRRNSTRAVAGIDQNIKLNRALWQLAEEMKKLKAA